MQLTKRRWRILIACCFVNICLGSIYTWSVFAGPMAEYLSTVTGLTLTSADLAIVYTVANSVGPITMITGGWFNDRFGPKKVILVGGVMFASGMILSGFATSLGMLIVTYGLLTGLGLGMAYGCTISSCVKFFPDKRGTIGGITTAVYGMGSVVLPPVITSIVYHFNAPTAFKMIGVAFLVIIVICVNFIEKCPQDFQPEGWKKPEKPVNKTSTVDKDWKEMLKSPVFYIMIILLTCGAFSGMMIISQASAVAQFMTGMSVGAASAVVSAIALFNTAGRIASGYLSDKFGRITTLTGVCFVSACGLLMLYFCKEGTFVSFCIGVAIVGFCFGSIMGIFPGFTADQFGAKNNSVNYGIMFIGFALAGYFGPTVMKIIFAGQNSYQLAFLVACVLSVIGFALTFVYRIVVRR